VTRRQPGPARAPDAPRGGPPPLRPFGLRLHHDGRWSHEGTPIANARLRALFDKGAATVSSVWRGGR